LDFASRLSQAIAAFAGPKQPDYQAYEAKKRIIYIVFDCAASPGWRMLPG